MRRILLTGGGSGGHIFPLIAVIRQIRRLAADKNIDIDIRYYGPRDIYTSYIVKEDVAVKGIASAKLRRYFSLRNLTDFPKFIFSIFQALFKIYWLMPDIAFSKGGPGALPVLLACRFYLIPIIIHESDSIPGLTNQISGRFAGRIELSFADSKKYFPGKDVRVVGNPVREELLAAVSLDPVGAKERLKLDLSLPLILILGGSLGSVRINDFVLTNLELLLRRAQIIHQVGTANYDQMKKYQKKNYKIFAFLEEKYPEVLAASDLVISRAGGIIFELAALGKPAILVPLPESANDHQRANAYEYTQTGAAQVIEEPNLLSNVVLREIDKILNNPDRQNKMRKAALNFAKPEAAEQIAADILR